MPGKLIRITTNRLNKLIYEINIRKYTIIKFILFSGSAVILNLLLLYIMVTYLGFNDKLGENIANAISMEISIIYNFFVSRIFTWKDRKREKGINLFIQICKFHVTIGLTLLFRLILFPILQYFGVFYIINSAIGIIISAIFNFIIYDSLVFKKGDINHV